MSRLRLPSARLVGALLFALTLPGAAQSPPPAEAKDDPAVLSAEILPRASKSLLLDLAQTTAGIFAIGERGHILSSNDGKNWTQRPVPTRATLTTITSVNGQLWAGGHDGVILHSSDGGQSWQRQRVAPWSADDNDPSHGVPIMDLLFTDAMHGYAVGAYSLMLTTEDGGASWTTHKINAAAPAAAAKTDDKANDESWTFNSDQLQLGDESDPHFNAIARTGSGALLIAGERGTIYRSEDSGANWQKMKLPYDGSMFGVLAWDEGHVLVFGLRGNVYESTDLGASWNKVETGSKANLMGGQALPGGGAVLVGANGTVLIRKDAASPFVLSTFENAAGETPVLAAVLPLANGGYLLVGDKGVDTYSPK